jgi:Zn-dependent protease with chaperone function
MITVGYGIAALYLGAMVASALGALLLGRQVQRSRSAVLFIFLWGPLVSLSIIILLNGIIHGLTRWPGIPYLVHLHETEFHLHNNFPLMEEPLTICHHIAYLSLQLPPHTYFLPLLALGIPVASFAANQAYVSWVHARLSAIKDEALSSQLRGRMSAFWPGRSWDVMVVEGSTVEALSYALLRPALRPFRLARDVVVVTKGLYRLLEEEEVIASLAHEFAHLESNDNRYLTFFKTLCGFVFFDPAVVLMSQRLCREAEFRADYEAARVTQKPLALARALLKVYMGPGQRYDAREPAPPSRSLLVERIERLLTLAGEMGEPGPDSLGPGGGPVAPG